MQKLAPNFVMSNYIKLNYLHKIVYNNIFDTSTIYIYIKAKLFLLEQFTSGIIS